MIRLLIFLMNAFILLKRRMRNSDPRFVLQLRNYVPQQNFFSTQRRLIFKGIVRPKMKMHLLSPLHYFNDEVGEV